MLFLFNKSVNLPLPTQSRNTFSGTQMDFQSTYKDFMNSLYFGFFIRSMKCITF